MRKRALQIPPFAHRAFSTLCRILVLSTIVIFVGAISCTQILGAMKFAPGYGYVLVVEYGSHGDRKMYVFETAEAANQWARNFDRTASKGEAMRAPGYKLVVDEGSPRSEERDLFRKIWPTLRPIPAPDVTRTIDGVVPPIPTAPAPQ